MWFAAPGILVLFLYVNPTLSKVATTDATIKDAILSLARVIRDNSQRVDRHQARERLMNENLKKSIEDLSKKMSMIDTFMTRFTKIESQLSEFEQLISQQDERERIQMQKTIWSIQKLEMNMEERFGRIINPITEISQRVEPDMISKLDNTEAHLLEKFARIESRLNSTAIKNEGEAAMQAEKLQTLFTKLDEKERTQNQRTENLIENFENRLKAELKKIEDTITEVGQHVEPTEPTTTEKSISASEIMSKLDETEAHFLEKVARIESRLNRTAIKNDGEAVMQAEKLQTLFTKIDEKERSQNRKTEILIENLEDRLKTQLENITGTVTEISEHVKPDSVSASDIISKLDDTKVHFLEKVAGIESRLNTTAIKNEGQAATQAEELQTLFTKIDDKVSTQNQNTENLIEDLEKRLRTQLENITDTITEISQRVEPTEPAPTTASVSASDIMSKLDATEAHCIENVVRIESRLNSTAIKNDGEAVMQAEKLQTLFTKIDEKERSQNRKTEILIENLEDRLKTQLENITGTVTEISEHVKPDSVSASDIISKLDDTKVHFLEKVAGIESRLNTTAIENEGEAATRAEKLQTVFTEVQDITRKLESIESYLERAQTAANEAEEKLKKPMVDIGAICEEQTKALGKVTELVEDTLNHIQVLPTTFEVQLLHNETQAALDETHHSLQSIVDDRINRVINSVDQHNNETKDTIGNLRTDLATNAEHVNQKLGALENGQEVMVSTADDVSSLKKKLEYGISGITGNVGDLIRSHDAGKKNLSDKIDKISNYIIDHLGKEIRNLTLETDEGLKRIWRQIEMLFQTTMTNGDALDKLNQQNEICINGTISTITGMEVEVADIQSHMNQAEGNLNYLLRQRSWMTQEFNTLKSNLRNALSNIKSSIKEKQEKTENLQHSERHLNRKEPLGSVDIQ